MPQRQLQWDKSTLQNVLILSMVLLNRKTNEEFLPIVGVLLPDPPLFCMPIGKTEKEEAMREVHYSSGFLMRLLASKLVEGNRKLLPN